MGKTDMNSASSSRKIRIYDRREFGRAAAAALTGAAAARPMPFFGAETPPPAPPLPGAQRRKQGAVYARPLGDTGLWLSELSIGGSPSPPPNVFLAALERGVNYCDTSPRYSQGKGEEGIGKILQGRRDQVYVGTKFTPTRDGVMNTADAIRQVEGSLKRLATDRIDLLCVHGARSEAEVLSDWVFEAMEKLHAAGKARFFGVSVHNTAFEFNRKLIECGKYHALLIPMNMYYDKKALGDNAAKGPEDLAAILKLAAEKGVGIIAMKTLAAGGLANVPTPDGVSPAQAKLRWVLRRPEVTSILNEMVTFEYLADDLAASAADLSPREEAWLRDNAAEGSRRFCRMCRTCEGQCPARIPVADLLRARMYAADYGQIARAKDLARRLRASERLRACTRCGTCEAVCPWRVRTTDLLGDLRSLLG